MVNEAKDLRPAPITKFKVRNVIFKTKEDAEKSELVKAGHKITPVYYSKPKNMENAIRIKLINSTKSLSQMIHESDLSLGQIKSILNEYSDPHFVHIPPEGTRVNHSVLGGGTVKDQSSQKDGGHGIMNVDFDDGKTRKVHYSSVSPEEDFTHIALIKHDDPSIVDENGKPVTFHSIIPVHGTNETAGSKALTKLGKNAINPKINVVDGRAVK